MKHKKKFLWIIVLIFLIIPSLFFLVSYFVSPPQAGKKIAESYGVVYPAIIAHRGASSWAPEGTKAAYELAAAMGADYLEVDLQRSKDGVIVVFHDTNLQRTTDVEQVFPKQKDDLLGAFTYAQLQQLDAGSWFNRKYPHRARQSYSSLKILRLETVLAIARQYGSQIGIYIETKSPEKFPGIEQQIVAILTANGWQDKVIFQSFSLASLQNFKILAPQFPRVLLISMSMAEHGVYKLLAAAKNDVQGIGPNGRLAWPWLIANAHQYNLLVHPYTINATWQMQLLTQFGVDGFFTDYSDKALLFYGKKQQVNVAKILEKLVY